MGRPRRHEVVLANEAEDELVELIQYIAKDSRKNADDVLEAILKRRDLLRTDPRAGHADPSAPLVPEGSQALVTTVKKIGVYYLFPFTRGDADIVFIVSIRRGSRMPVEAPEYMRRWLEEISKLPARRAEGPG